jgi:type IV pilus assembly protein PilB
MVGDGGPNRRTASQREAHYARAAPGGTELSAPARGKLGFNLIKLGYVKDDEITALLSKQYGVPSIALGSSTIDPAVVKLVPGRDRAEVPDHPALASGATLTIAMTDPTNVFAMDDIKFMTGYNVEPVVASETAVLDAITKYYGKPSRRRPVATAPLRQQRARVASKALEEMPALGDAGDVEVLEEFEEISAERSPSRARKRRSSSWST